MRARKSRRLTFIVLSAMALVGAAATTGSAVVLMSGTSREEPPPVAAAHGAGYGAETISLAAARDFTSFPLYYLGGDFKGWPLVAVRRTNEAPRLGDIVRRDDVTFIYGRCDTSRGSCAPPIQVQVWDACERYAGIYDPLMHADGALEIRGVPARFYDDFMRLELYSGRVTIVIFSGRRLSEEALREAARSVRGLTLPLSVSENLPSAVPGVQEGRLSCQKR